MDTETPYWIGWSISVVNRDTHVVSSRRLYLNLATLPPEDQARMRGILKDRRRSPEIVRYRHLFQPQMPTATSDQQAIARGGFASLSVHGYHEDDAGNPLDEIGFAEAVTGVKDPIIVGNAYSVTRHGPSPMIRCDKWTMRASNEIAHFLEITKCLSKSPWINTEVSINYTHGSSGEDVLLGFQRPDVLMFTSVLVFLRQLVSSDAVFNRAANHYLCHIGSDGKRLYVKERKRYLNAVTKKPDFLVSDRPAIDVMDLYMYGFGLIHRDDEDSIRDFHEMVGKHGHQKLVLAFQSVLQQIACTAINVASVIGQDFTHWVATGQAALPDRIGIEEVFGPVGRND